LETVDSEELYTVRLAGITLSSWTAGVIKEKAYSSDSNSNNNIILSGHQIA
jgi:hypothetical protein